MNKFCSIPISIKGIVFEDNGVWLRKNERNEWELPGGKMDEGEQPEETVVRELREELGFKVEVIDIVQAYIYTIKSSKNDSKVLVVTYLCRLLKKTGGFEVDGEADKAEFKNYPLEKIVSLNMPQFYKNAILKSSRHKLVRTSSTMGS